jgi:hypothetical protein
LTYQDKAILRELAKAYRERAEDGVNQERIRRIRDMNNLKPVRPLVWIDEIPWHEMDINGELALQCDSEEGRSMEQFFRRVLFRWKYFQVDMVVDDTFYISKSSTDSGIGISIIEQTIENTRGGNIVSHHYEDQLDTEEKVEALLIPRIEACPEIDKKNMEIAQEVLDGILPVKLRGYFIYHAPWDQIARYRGVEPCLFDMVDRPEFVHKTIAKFTEIHLACMEQSEKLGLLDHNLSDLHCTPPYCDGIPAKDYGGGQARLKDIWFRATAQLFSSASPAMLDEYDLAYMKPLMARCALGYYGCCEPLDKAIPYLKKIPNLRKIGVSPWANVRSSAEQIGGAYVYARKPNPAMVAMVFNKEAVEKETIETIEACRENKCPYEFVLKDISSVGGKPKNLIDWANTVTAVIDRYY